MAAARDSSTDSPYRSVSRLFSISLFFSLAFASVAGFAQTAPAEEKKDDKSKPAYAGYETGFELEVGGSLVDIHGSEQKYRSDVNVREGAQVKSFSLNLRPSEGKRGFFDILTVRGHGFGGVEPFENLKLQARRNGRYDFQFNYSKDHYYFDVPGFALGLHSDDVLRRSYDLSLQVYLQRNLKLRMGYTANQRSGNTLTSDDVFNDVYQLILFNRARTDDYRIGVEWQSRAVSLAFDQSFRSFRFDDHLTNTRAGQLGIDPVSPGILKSYREDLPTRGFIPSSQVTMKFRPSDRFELLGRYRYSRGSVDFTRSDVQSLRFGAGTALDQLISTQASANQRPQHLVDVNASWFLAPRWSVHNSFDDHRYEITSAALTSTIFRAPGSGAQLSFSDSGSDFTHYSRTSNDAYVEFEASRLISASAGYRYASRVVRLRSADDQSEERTNTISRAVVASLSASGGSAFRGSLEFEHGWADNVLLRIEPLDFNRVTGRGSYRPSPNLSFSGSFGIRFEKRPISGSWHKLDNKEYSLQASWTPKPDYLLEAGWGRLDILSATDLYFFLSSSQVDRSQYVTNSDYGNLLFQIPIQQRVRLQLDYRLLKDSGGSYPLIYHQGNTQLSFKLCSSTWFDVGWRYLAYNEDAYATRDYAGHIVSLGLRFKF